MVGTWMVPIVAVIVAAGLSAIGWLVGTRVIRPIEEDIETVAERADDAHDVGEQAMAKAEDVERKHDGLETYLLGSERAGDNGVLPQMQQSLQSIEDELQRQSRIETERAYTLQEIHQAIEQNEDGVTLDVGDDDPWTDGGTPNMGPFPEDDPRFEDD